MKEYFLDCDDDGHWYIVEESHRKDWHKWLSDYDDYDVPEYAEEIATSLCQVIFKDYRIL